MAAGRPTKAETILYRLAFRDEIDEVLRKGYVRLDDRYGIAEDAGVMAKLDAISESLKKAHSDAAKSKSTRAFDAAMAHPWMTSMDPVTYGRQLMQQHWICQRVIEVLETHLVDYALVQASIQRRLRTVRDTVSDKLEDVPETIMEFARRLHRAGMKATPAIQNLGPDDMSAIAEAFNSRDATAMASVFRSGRKPMTDEERDRLREDARWIEAEHEAARPPEVGPSPLFVHVPPPPIHPPGTEWTDMTTAAPPEFFDGIDDVGLPYRWQYRDARDDETKGVLDLPMPPQDTWEKLKIFDNNIAQEMEMRKFDITEVEDVVRSYVGFRGRIRTRDVPDNWVKAWILLLIARPTPEIMSLLLGDRLETYFDGVRLPVISMGSGRIRELVRVAS